MKLKLKVQTFNLHMSELSYIQIERRPDDIAIITINRPEVLNAINQRSKSAFLLGGEVLREC